MSKYDGLGPFLQKQKTEAVPMTFAEIERVVGTKLPASKRYPAWWSNYPQNNVMTKVWLNAGFRTEQVDIESQKLVFRRAGPQQQGKNDREKKEAGMSDSARTFEHSQTERKPRRHPLFGAMKGTFTLVPPSDDEPPPEDPESWEALNLAKLYKLLFGKGE
jgi:hypothetical protein